MAERSETSRRAGLHPGPSPLLVVSIHTALFVSGLLAVTAFAHGGSYPSPFREHPAARDFFTANAQAVRVAACLQLGSAIPLAIFTATVTSQLRFLGIQAAGVSIALVGGVCSSVMLCLASVTSWTIAFVAPEPRADLVVRALQLAGFATGGPAAVAFLGLLVGGVGITARSSKLLPRWFGGLSVVILVVAATSTYALIVPAATWLVPTARFGSLLWLIAAAARLPRQRRTSRSPGDSP